MDERCVWAGVRGRGQMGDPRSASWQLEGFQRTCSAGPLAKLRNTKFCFTLSMQSPGPRRASAAHRCRFPVRASSVSLNLCSIKQPFFGHGFGIEQMVSYQAADCASERALPVQSSDILWVLTRRLRRNTGEST
eukprot:TRINITY_DN62088_c0_g1_i1.p1 TRINITY_DN62088_c0_g1~~TRINITY_DN62088_c0_g1_i1.p1  ORF type:complete len:134 (-),score=8.13 TRINITY_DN62088_c0_g1_i1:285-686(-)